MSSSSSSSSSLFLLRWGPLGWALLLVTLAFSATSSLGDDDNCKKYTNCSSCIADTQQNCTWFQCKVLNESHCTNTTDTLPDCEKNQACSADPTTSIAPTVTNTTASGNTTNTTTSHPASSAPPNTTVIASTTAHATTHIPGTVSPKPTSKPSPHTSTFDAASFIGGIVLVLGLQAVIFFLYKFCKSKEQNYHTL